jgi:hypothetical protein
MKRIIPFYLIVGCLSTVYAQYENGGVITTYVGDVDCLSGLLVVKNGGGASLLEMQNTSRLEIQSTSPLGYLGGIDDIRLKHNSHLDYYGGWTDELSMRNYSTAKLYGGRIDYISSYQKVFDVIVGWDKQGKPIFNTHIEMFVRDYKYNPASMRITGTWEDYTTFNIKLLDQSSDPRFDPAIDNIKFTIIPEPATFVLLILGGSLLRRMK